MTSESTSAVSGPRAVNSARVLGSFFVAVVPGGPVFSWHLQNTQRNPRERLNTDTYTGWWFGTSIAFSHDYWVANHPNWLSYFSEGWLNHQPDIVHSYKFHWCSTIFFGFFLPFLSCKIEQWFPIVGFGFFDRCRLCCTLILRCLDQSKGLNPHIYYIGPLGPSHSGVKCPMSRKRVLHAFSFVDYGFVPKIRYPKSRMFCYHLDQKKIASLGQAPLLDKPIRKIVEDADFPLTIKSIV